MNAPSFNLPTSLTFTPIWDGVGASFDGSGRDLAFESNTLQQCRERVLRCLVLRGADAYAAAELVATAPFMVSQR